MRVRLSARKVLYWNFLIYLNKEIDRRDAYLYRYLRQSNMAVVYNNHIKKHLWYLHFKAHTSFGNTISGSSTWPQEGKTLNGQRVPAVSVTSHFEMQVTVIWRQTNKKPLWTMEISDVLIPLVFQNEYDTYTFIFSSCQYRNYYSICNFINVG